MIETCHLKNVVTCLQSILSFVLSRKIIQLIKKLKINNNLIKKSKKSYSQENASKRSAPSKSLWNTVKPFISSKGTLSNDNIIIEDPNDATLTIKGGNLVSIKAKDEIRDEKDSS